MGSRQAVAARDQGRCLMAGLLDFGSEEERLAQQRALQAYADQVGKQQDRQAVWDALGQTLPAQIVKSIYQAARLPGDVYQGKVDPQSPEAIGRAADFAGSVMLGGMPFGHQAAKQAASEGSALIGMFAGPSAKTADLGALKMAQEMAQAGASRDDIWNKTGWFQGVDKKWRFEIPDNTSFYRALDPKDGDTVGRQLAHQQLFAAYPEMENIQHFAINPRAVTGGMQQGEYRTGYDPTNRAHDQILLGGPNKSSTILHELQHAVQNQEGFARGGNTTALQKNTPAWEIYQERLAAMRNPLTLEQYAKFAGFDNVDDAAKSYKGYLKQIKKIDPVADRAAQEYGVENAYRRLAGEVEARNVQKRLDMTPQERKASPPWMTQDVLDENQFIRGLPEQKRPYIKKEDIERGLL